MLAPDVLVLGAGGSDSGEWMAGVLAGIVEASGIDFAATEHLVGTSAGALLAAELLAGVEPREPGAEPTRQGEHADPSADVVPPAPDPAAAPEGTDDATAPPPQGEGRAAGVLHAGFSLAGGVLATVATPFVPRALTVARPLSTRVRAAALARVESPHRTLAAMRERVDALGLQFDGRLRVACVERSSGRRVVFGAPGAPSATVAKAVQASCSAPWQQQPVEIGEQAYVDGSLWSPTNLDAAPALRDTHVLCLAPASGQLGPRARHPAVQAAAHAALTIETLALRSRGTILDLIAPDDTAAGDGDPRRAGYAQGLAFVRDR